jgi:flavin-dependent dehydrogenase
LKPKLVKFGVDNSGPLFGYQAVRADLDRILLDEALRQGVILTQPCRVNDVIVESSRVIGLKTSNGEIYSDFVIDSGGATHWLARKLHLSIEKYSRPLIVSYGYVKGEYTPLDEAPFFVALVNGWLWTSKIIENLYQWIRLGLTKEAIATGGVRLNF